MGFMGSNSILQTKTIKKVLLNKKDYKFQDFKFKIINEGQYTWQTNPSDFFVEVYDFDTLILKVWINEFTKLKEEERFEMNVVYFNPQTNNDCFSINHIIAVFNSLVCEEDRHTDKGNAEVLNNQYIFRKRTNYYSYTKLWTIGKIEEGNYNKNLSYEFATDEYINYVKKIYGFKAIQRRKIKEHFRTMLDKMIVVKRLKQK